MIFQSKQGTWSTAEIGGSEFVPGGLLGFEITARGYAPYLNRRVAARIDAAPADFEVRLARAATVRGEVVVAATGAKVAGATVRVTSVDRPLPGVTLWTPMDVIS